MFALPFEAVGQVRLPAFRNLVTGELVELPNANRYERWLDDRRRSGQLARTEKILKFHERKAAYTADACGLGCEGHEGLQVRSISGTDLTAVLYKVRRNDDVLTVQLRFHNDGDRAARLRLDPYDACGSFYVQAGDQRRGILADEDGGLQSKDALNEELEPGEIESWWARFAAPPAGATVFDLHLPAVTFLDVKLDDD
jgi:hypothetical protein